MNIYNLFRIIAFLEGLSFLVLLVISIIWRIEKYIPSIGLAHGLLFIIYIIMALFFYKKKLWNQKELIIILLCSVIPFGAFYVDSNYINNIKNKS
tara:strand:- start:550 stop:834 length:285 start_codon:yes stop_codon:yes gene_type:complete